jgi:hypothetical protein
MLAMRHDWPLDVTELKPALELVLAIARTDMGILMLHDDGEGAMFPVLGYGLDETNYELFGSPRPGIGAFGRAMTEHRRVRIRNAWGKDAALSDAARTLGFRSIEVLPFSRGRRRARRIRRAFSEWPWIWASRGEARAVLH